MSAAGIPAPLRRSEGRIAAFAYPESAARALGRAAERADWLRRPAGRVVEPAGIDRDAAAATVDEALAAAPDAWLGPEAIRRVLAAYGVRLVPERVAGTVDDAVRAASDLGFPVVVKTAEPGVHKTEIAGVALDLADADAVRDAATRIGPPVIVQPMLAGNAELLAGLVQDPVFGPLVAFGPGGRLAELMGEAQFAIAPLTDVDARELVAGGNAARLVEGFRGAPPSDGSALADLLLRLSRLGEDLPEIVELDLNPVLALDEGYVALDARARVCRADAVAPAKTW
jgi:acyl-CoA synthetase (NDP forming)